MEIEQMIEVLNHFKNGGTIEQRLLKFPSQESDWKEISMPLWSFCVYEYRIKEEPKRIPYSYEDILTGKTILDKESTIRHLITSQDEEGVFNFEGCFTSYKELLNDFTHVDGSPFGKLI